MVLSAIWFAITALVVRAHLNDVKAEVTALHQRVADGDIAGARRLAAQVRDDAHTAHLFSSGPVWAVAAAVPELGDPVDSVRGLSAAADRLGSRVIPPLVDLSEQLDPSNLRAADGTFRLQQIEAASPVVDRAAAGARDAVKLVDGIPRDTWLDAANSARASLASSLGTLAQTLTGLSKAARVAPTMLGAHGPQRYFVGMLNDAESRGIGGMPGSFAIVEANRGRIAFTHFGSDSELDGVSANVDLGPAFAARYRREQPTRRYIWSDTSPHFPYAARIWAAMWKAKTGQTITGAAAIDPTALSYLLAVTGPVRAQDGTLVSASNVVALTQSTLYARYPKFSQQPARKRFLTGISDAVDGALMQAKDTKGMLKALAHADGERRLLLWSAEPSVESTLSTTAIAGIVPRTDAPYVGPVITSVAGNKLDYYLDRNITVARAQCEAVTQVVVTAKLTNTAPKSGLSPYVTLRNDHPKYKVRPGDQNLNFNYFATSGARLVGATLDGAPVKPVVGEEQGHPTYQVGVELPVGATRTLTLTLAEPVSKAAPIVLRQPLVRPLNLRVLAGACG